MAVMQKPPIIRSSLLLLTSLITWDIICKQQLAGLCTSLPLRVHPFYAESSYSREEVIATIQLSYELLIKLPYIEPNALVFAPPKGWSGVHAEELRRRGNVEEVIELLQHLPYLRVSYHLATSQ